MQDHWTDSLDLRQFPTLFRRIEDDLKELGIRDPSLEKFRDFERIVRHLLQFFVVFNTDHAYVPTQQDLADFEAFLLALWDSWNYCWIKALEESNSESVDGWTTHPHVRDLLLTQAVHRQDGTAFGTIDRENTRLLSSLVVRRGWRWQQIGQYDSPNELIRDFYLDLSARKKWDVFKGYTKISGWLPVYLHAFLRDSLRQGIRDTDSQPSTDKEAAPNERKRDKRFTTLPDHVASKEHHGPEHVFVLGEIQRLVQDAFSRLSPNDQLFLCFYLEKRRQEFQQTEMCKEIGLTPSTFTRTKQRILERFSEILHELLKSQFPSSFAAPLLSIAEIEELIAPYFPQALE